MIEEKKAGREQENVLIMVERLAFLHYAFAKAISDALPSPQAEELIHTAIRTYGQLTADSVTKKLQEQGMEPKLKNYKYGKDLPSVGWEISPMEMPAGKAAGKISKVNFCPLAKIWKNLGDDGIRLGRAYCYVDQEKYRAYGKGYQCFHDQNTLDGADCCVIRVEQGSEE